MPAKNAKLILEVIKNLSQAQSVLLSKEKDSLIGDSLLDLKIVLGRMTKPEGYKCECCGIDLTVGNCPDLIRPAEFFCNNCKENNYEKDVYL